MFTLKEISEALSFPLVGDGGLLVSAPAEPKLASELSLALAMDPKYLDDLKNSKARAAILMENTDWRSLGLDGAILVSRARYALSGINSLFEKPVEVEPGVHPTAIIDQTAKIGRGTRIGAFTIIGSNCQIGNDCTIANHVSIGSNTVIANNAILHNGVRITSGVKIGNRFICQSNAVIGSAGFSYVSPEFGGVEEIRKKGKTDKINKINQYVRIATLGSVVLGDDVEIGANCTIDSGTISDTRIGNGTKIDNLVHIGHNVIIGINCLLCGQVGIAGSTKLGDRVVLGGQVGVADHLSIGDDTVVAGKSGVSSNIPREQFMMGNPAMKIENSVSSYKAFRRLPRLLRKMEQFEVFLKNKSLFKDE